VWAIGGEERPGVVVDDVEDLHVGAVGKVPVGGVGRDLTMCACVPCPMRGGRNRRRVTLRPRRRNSPPISLPAYRSVNRPLIRLRRVFARIACPDCGSSRFVPLTFSRNPLRGERAEIDPEDAGDPLLFKCVICGVPFKWVEHVR
jgi:hypothetical protein